MGNPPVMQKAMKVGDLVKLNSDIFSSPACFMYIGVIMKKLKPIRGGMFLILWNDGSLEAFHEEDLEAAYV